VEEHFYLALPLLIALLMRRPSARKTAAVLAFVVLFGIVLRAFLNVASACGFTPQYTALEAVYEKCKDKGLVIVGVPANNFGNQESGTNATIKEFCSAKFHVKFPMMAKVSVKGDDKTPLYQYLTAAPNVSGEIKWNFTKFLIARNGQPIARFEPAVTPDSPQVISAIESALKP
jgi:glutathione peroxidase